METKYPGLVFKSGIAPLSHDVHMAEEFGERYTSLHHSAKVERRIVWALIGQLKKHGWQCRVAFDSECSYYIGDDGKLFEDYEANLWSHRGPAISREKVMDIAFNLDEVSLRFGKGDSDVLHGVYVVLGNGVDCIADWNYSDGDPDGFNAILDTFTENIERFE